MKLPLNGTTANTLCDISQIYQIYMVYILFFGCNEHANLLDGYLFGKHVVFS